MGAPALKTPPTVYEFRLPISTEAALAEFLLRAYGITIPKTRVCPEHSTPWAAFCEAYFARVPLSVWVGSRGFGGKSFLLALLGLVEAQTLKIDVNLLGGSGLQSKRVHEYMRQFWDAKHAPRQLLAGDPLKTETALVWGNVITALMASQASVRGSHVPRLRLDEIDVMALDIFDASLGQTMEKPPADDLRAAKIPAHTVASSTWHLPNGTMTEVLKRAEDKGFPVHRWCHRETANPIDGWLDPREVERKRHELTAEQFRVEYDLGAPSSEGRAILNEAVDWTFRGEFGESPGEMGRAYEFEAPEPGATYATGADWARKEDKTVIDTFRTDCRPVRRVAWERRTRQPWPVMIEAFNKRVARYPGAACHDGTGIGDVIREWVHGEAEAFQMVGKPRTELFTDYIAALESQAIASPRIAPCESAHRFVSNDDLFGSGHPPDEFVAGALAWKAAALTAKPARFW